MAHCGVVYIAFSSSLYALLSLWAFLLLFKNGIFYGIHRHSAKAIWSEHWSFSHVSEIHSETISGRGSFSHYWTAIGLSNCILGMVIGLPFGGLDQLPFFFLAVFPLRSPADKICGFLPIPDAFVACVHYLIVVTYFGLSSAMIMLNNSMWDAVVQFALAAIALLLLACNSRFAVEFEAFTSTYICIYYLRMAVTMTPCFIP